MTTSSPWHDTMVAEIHATRERLAAQYHNDLLAYPLAAQPRCSALGLMTAPNQHRVARRPAASEFGAIQGSAKPGALLQRRFAGSICQAAQPGGLMWRLLSCWFSAKSSQNHCFEPQYPPNGGYVLRRF